jgi:hypothetical protein
VVSRYGSETLIRTDLGIWWGWGIAERTLDFPQYALFLEGEPLFKDKQNKILLKITAINYVFTFVKT